MEMSNQKESQMNRYGAQAQSHFQKFLPTRHAQIQDPTEFFTSLGQEMADQITELKLTLAGDDPGGETFLEKVGRLNAAEQMARERVLAEMLPTPENAEDDELEPAALS
jgi:hypothetical protein